MFVDPRHVNSYYSQFFRTIEGGGEEVPPLGEAKKSHKINKDVRSWPGVG